MVLLVLFGLLLNPQVQSDSAAQDPDLARLEEDVRRSPSDAIAWKRLGLAMASRRKLAAAVPALAKACELGPADEDACYYLARTLNALGRWDDAREPFEMAIRAAPKPMLARVHRATALNFMALGRASDAEKHFRLSISLNAEPELLPEDPRIDYGGFLFREGRTEDALKVLNEAVRTDPHSARARAQLGRILLHAGKGDAAVASLEEAVRLDPKASAVRLLLGRAYLQIGRVEDGQKQLELARRSLGGEDGSSPVK